MEPADRTKILIIDGDDAFHGIVGKVLEEVDTNYSLNTASLSAVDTVTREGVRLVFAGHYDPDAILKTSSSFPDASIVLLHEGAVTSETIELLAKRPVQIVRKPYNYQLVKEIVEMSGVAPQEQQEFRMNLSISSREASQMNVSFPMADWLLQAGTITPKECKSLHVTFQEAITNSLEHGNLGLKSEWKEDLDDKGVDRYSLEKSARLTDDYYGSKMLTVNSWYDGEYLHLEIQDEGKGFNVERVVQRPTAIDASYGRGLSIITAYMDHVEFDNNGTKIMARKRLGT